MITTGVPHPTVALRGVCHSGFPVSVAKAATNEPPASRAVVILIDEDAVLVQHRRAGAAVIVVQPADGAVPHDLAVDIGGQQAVAAERRIDAPAIGDRRRRRVAVLWMPELDAAAAARRFPTTACRPIDESRSATAAVRRHTRS